MKTGLKKFLGWEWLLLALIAIVFLFFQSQLPGSYTLPKLMGQTRVYMVDVGFMALGMMLILIMGDIDISVASIASLSCTIMGVSYNGGNGAPFPVALLLGIIVGALCGLVNGYLITRFKELFPMIITLATSTLFRGIAYIILKDQSAGGFPDWFSTKLGYGMVNFGGFEVPIMLFFLLAMIPLFFVWLHMTPSGRRIFATGTNITTAQYSGLRIDRIKLTMFMLNGIMAAVGGIFLTARTGSVKYTMATGYEMQAIAIAVLGGASTAGGKGSVIGLLLSLVLMTCLKNGLMLMFNDAFVLNMAVGVLLIGIVLVPNLSNMIGAHRQLVKRRRDAVKLT